MMIYKLSGDVDELLGRPVGEVVAVDIQRDAVSTSNVVPNVVPIAEAFDESVTAEELPVPWEQQIENATYGVAWNVPPSNQWEVVSVEDHEQSSFSEMLPMLAPIAVDAETVESAETIEATEAVEPTEPTVPVEPIEPIPTPAGPTNEQVIARKLEICDLIQEVADEIKAVDEEIADLSTKLKAAKKFRETELERLQELSQQLKSAREDLCGERSPTSRVEGEGSDGDSDDATAVDAATTTADNESTIDPDAYNPWDHWEQGRAITSVRLLVETEGMVAGTACAVFDVEPPQEDGDSLSGSVTVFRLGSDRETVVLTKRECAPMLPGVKEPPIGHRIGVRAKAKASDNQPEDESWKSVPVTDLDIPSSLAAILIEDNSIRTIGDIQEWSRWKRLTDLKKVGQAKAEKIEEALVEFWKKR